MAWSAARRASTGVFFQVLNAARAAATASSSSPAVQAGTWPMTPSLAGLTTSSHWPLSTILPLIRFLYCVTICAFSLQVRTRLIALCNLLSGLAIPQQVLPARLGLGDKQFFT